MLKFALAILCLWSHPLSATAQDKAENQKTVSTIPKKIVARLGDNGKGKIEISGILTFTLARVSYDDSLQGTVSYELAEESRQRIAQFTGQLVTAVPPNVSAKDVILYPEKHTVCPQVHLEYERTVFKSLPRIEMEIVGAKAHFDNFVLDINETEQELSELLCLWLKRINNGRGGTRGPDWAHQSNN